MLWEEDALHRFDEILNYKSHHQQMSASCTESPHLSLSAVVSKATISESLCGASFPSVWGIFWKIRKQTSPSVSPHSLGNLSLVWGVCDSSHDVSLSRTPSFAVSTLWRMSAGDDIISGPQAMWRRRDLTPESSQAHGKLEWSCVPLSSRPHAVCPLMPLHCM